MLHFWTSTNCKKPGIGFALLLQLKQISMVPIEVLALQSFAELDSK